MEERNTNGGKMMSVNADANTELPETLGPSAHD